MNLLARILFLAVSLFMVAPVNSQPVEKLVESEVVMKAGNKVHLFHSGTADVKEEICLNDVIPVYREDMSGGHTSIKKVGKVKVIGYEGEYYFTAEVVSGEIKEGDIAKKYTASCLVQPRK